MDPTSEQEFQKWYADTAKKLKINANPDDPDHYYDYRKFYNAMKKGEVISPTAPGGHWPSKFKSADHPRRYLEDPINARLFDTESGRYTGGDRENVSGARMELLNSVDAPDLPREQWQRAHAGQNRALESLKDPWAGRENKSELLDPWEMPR